MSRYSPALVRAVGALGAIGIVVSWAYATSWLFVCLELLLLIDLVDASLRLLFGRRAMDTSLSPGDSRGPRFADWHSGATRFAILMSVHNLESEIDAFTERFRQLKSYCWIIDDASSDGTFRRLQMAGWHVIRNEGNTNKPAAIKRLLETIPAQIGTVVVTDPDTQLVSRSRGARDLLEFLSAFPASGVDVVCPRVTVSRGPFVTLLQELEYLFSFRIGRASLGTKSTASGVAIYRRELLEQILSSHSLSVYAEDLENTVLLLRSGHRIQYVDDLVFETQGKTTARDLFSQRVGWAYGLARVLLSRREELREIARHGPLTLYQYRIYLYYISFVLTPLRVVALIVAFSSLVNGFDNLLLLSAIPDVLVTSPALFSGIYIKYTLLVLVLTLLLSPSDQLLRHLVAVPLYAPYAIALAIPMTLGFLSYLSHLLLDAKLYDDHYEMSAT